MTEIIQIFSLVIFGSVLALVGGLVFLAVPRWSKLLSRYSVPFAGGVLLTVSLAALLPESVDMIGETAFLYTLATFLTIYLFEQLFFSLHHHQDVDDHHHHQLSAWWIVIGDTIHNLIDGVSIAASFVVSPGLGAVTAISTFLHEVPHEIGDFGVLLKAGWQKRTIIGANFASALVSVVGAALVLLFQPSNQLLGVLLSVSAGIFLYLGASDFLPHAGQNLNKAKMVTALLLGVSLMLVSIYLIPHAH